VSLQVPAVTSDLGQGKVNQAVNEDPESPGVTWCRVWLLHTMDTRGCWLLWRLLLLEIALSLFWNGKATGKYAAMQSYMPGTEET